MRLDRYVMYCVTFAVFPSGTCVWSQGSTQYDVTGYTVTRLTNSNQSDYYGYVTLFSGPRQVAYLGFYDAPARYGSFNPRSDYLVIPYKFSEFEHIVGVLRTEGAASIFGTYDEQNRVSFTVLHSGRRTTIAGSSATEATESIKTEDVRTFEVREGVMREPRAINSSKDAAEADGKSAENDAPDNATIEEERKLAVAPELEVTTYYARWSFDPLPSGQRKGLIFMQGPTGVVGSFETDSLTEFSAALEILRFEKPVRYDAERRRFLTAFDEPVGEQEGR